mgnify:CR=1 FL=1
MASKIQQQFASAFGGANAVAPPVQVVIPPQIQGGGGSTWKWIAIFLVGVILVGVVMIFTQKTATSGKRVRDVFKEEVRLEEEEDREDPPRKKKKRVRFELPPEEEEEDVEEEEEEVLLSPELERDPKFTSMQQILAQKASGAL